MFDLKVNLCNYIKQFFPTSVNYLIPTSVHAVHGDNLSMTNSPSLHLRILIQRTLHLTILIRKEIPICTIATVIR